MESLIITIIGIIGSIGGIWLLWLKIKNEKLKHQKLADDNKKEASEIIKGKVIQKAGRDASYIDQSTHYDFGGTNDRKER